ncbi:MAG TPA: carboxypeptidase regulatory-like domain-containing protein [Candidatus Limnocylindrales bacterium]|nr:carboxypeptidase regulatory-like domain-containing protein [Candidatus Limnocylindrales bacterium]
MRTRRAAVIIFFLLAALPSTAQIENGDHIIVGTVRDSASHQPVAGARIELVVGGAKLAAPPTSSNTEGEFELSAHKGDFFVHAEMAGYVTAEVKVSVGPAQETDVEIELRREAPRDSSASAPPEAISAHQLSVPGKARESFEKGMSLVGSKKDYSSAASEFQSAITAYPAYYEAYAELGVARYYLGDARAAEDALRKSVALSDGKYSYALLDLAELLNNTARFGDAEPVARQAVALDASASRAYYELARAQFGLKRPVDAEQSASKCRDLNPDYPLVYLTLANIHIALRNYAAVLIDLDSYLKLTPDGPTSDQVRHTRAQVARTLDRSQPPPASTPRQ